MIRAVAGVAVVVTVLAIAVPIIAACELLERRDIRRRKVANSIDTR